MEDFHMILDLLVTSYLKMRAMKAALDEAGRRGA